MRHFREWLFNEAVWDWETTAISRIIINVIKSHVDDLSKYDGFEMAYKSNTNDPNRLNSHIKPDKEITLEPYIQQLAAGNKLKELPPIRVYVYKESKSRAYSGAFDHTNDTVLVINIDIAIDDKNRPIITRELVADLKYLIRHELEHFSQFKADPKDFVNNIKSKNDDGAEKYTTSKIETPAHVAGINTKARVLRHSGATFGSVVGDYLKRVKPIATANKIGDKWSKYYTDRYKKPANVTPIKPNPRPE